MSEGEVKVKFVPPLTMPDTEYEQLLYAEGLIETRTMTLEEIRAQYEFWVNTGLTILPPIA